MRRLPRLGEVVRGPEAAMPCERLRVRSSLWVDARPSPGVAREFAESVRQSAERTIRVIELRIDSSEKAPESIWAAASLAQLSTRLRSGRAGLESGACVFWGELAGQLIEPDLVVRLGSPSLFSANLHGIPLIQLPSPRPEVVAAIAKRLDRSPC